MEIKFESCNICNAKKEKQYNIFTDNQIDDFLKGIHRGIYKSGSKLSLDYYKTVSEFLFQGAEKGYGKKLAKLDYTTPDYKTLASMQENVYVFSGAKNYQCTKYIQQLLIKDGQIQSFSNFKKDAMPLFERYNRDYLTTEYNSAIAQGRSASMWKEIEADSDVYDQLQYMTAGDSRVRPEHAVLNYTVRPVKDKFWDMYFPPNGWNCRCTVLQVFGEKVTDLRTKHISTRDVTPIFRFNAGKEKIIYSPEHPYFDVAKKDKAFAKENFGLPLPSKNK